MNLALLSCTEPSSQLSASCLLMLAVEVAENLASLSLLGVYLHCSGIYLGPLITGNKIAYYICAVGSLYISDTNPHRVYTHKAFFRSWRCFALSLLFCFLLLELAMPQELFVGSKPGKVYSHLLFQEFCLFSSYLWVFLGSRCEAGVWHCPTHMATSPVASIERRLFTQWPILVLMSRVSKPQTSGFVSLCPAALIYTPHQTESVGNRHFPLHHPQW